MLIYWTGLLRDPDDNPGHSTKCYSCLSCAYKLTYLLTYLFTYLLTYLRLHSPTADLQFSLSLRGIMYTVIYKYLHSHGCEDATVQTTINIQEHSADKNSRYIPISASNRILYGRRRGRRRRALCVGLPLGDQSITIWRRWRFSRRILPLPRDLSTNTYLLTYLLMLDCLLLTLLLDQLQIAVNLLTRFTIWLYRYCWSGDRKGISGM